MLNNSGAMTSIVLPLCLILWVLGESGRLYLGYTGNLHEKVPHLAAFLFVTFFPQLLITIFLCAIQSPLLPIDKVMGYFMIIFIVTEFILGYRAARRIIVNKTARFAVEYVDEDDAPVDDPNDIHLFDDSKYSTKRSAAQSKPQAVQMQQLSNDSKSSGVVRNDSWAESGRVARPHSRVSTSVSSDSIQAGIEMSHLNREASSSRR
jgi:Predicted membrane protein